MNVTGLAVIVLGAIGLLAALLLFIVAKRFRVDEDPRISEIESLLPGANCGSCGRSGCRDFAVACVGATTLEGLNCPGAGSAVMAKIGKITGLAPVATAPKVAFLKCNGTCSLRPDTNTYSGLRSCLLENSVYGGESACLYGCLGCGDCVEACPYDALSLDPATGLPSVDLAKCVGCGRCVDACPRGVFVLLERMSEPRAFVACNNHDKGAAALKECEVACIGCGKCKKVCPSEAVDLSVFLASIDQHKCTGCGACVEACPRKSIHMNEPNNQPA